ncbi:hypothetical protein [Streptomyces marispadix]|uniref:Uncharacterized protein n=1 Tax=Streptomyces marispadix TaxID=2922868 RepID=A0ABS9T0F7_9ACTN|nr:hypothetical protein [Streptomyces marispadix]MCH6162017.1 hypothetical protein [Streptomyces marispadix]
MSAVRAPERIGGTGKVTLARIWAGLPGWGTYGLLYATALVDGRVTATLAAADPAALDTWLSANSARPYGNPAAEKRTLWAWAAAAESPQGASESQPAYERRLATYLARTGHAARLSSASRDLMCTEWEMDLDGALSLAAPGGDAGHAGHHQLWIGKLRSLQSTD